MANYSEANVLDKDLKDWRRLLENWEKFVYKQRPKARIIVRRGIPPAIRGMAWKKISGAADLVARGGGIYESLLQEASPMMECLESDISRTFPNAGLDERDQRAMYNVLKAFSIMDPEVGYCQGMSFLVGILLSHMDEVDAFWVLVSLLKIHRLRGLFMGGLPLLKHYLYRFSRLVTTYLPHLARHLDRQGVQTLYFSAEWFATLFSYALPSETTARIWDVVLLEGPDYLFAVGLAILKTAEEELLSLGFDGIIRKVKSHAAEVSPAILTVADKFTNLEKILRNIDEKFEREKDRIFSENIDGDFQEMNIERKLYTSSSWTPKMGNVIPNTDVSERTDSENVPEAGKTGKNDTPDFRISDFRISKKKLVSDQDGHELDLFQVENIKMEEKEEKLADQEQGKSPM